MDIVKNIAPRLGGLLSYKLGFIKIKLHFTTEEPKHIRSYILKNTWGFNGPYLEDVCVLMRQEAVFQDYFTFIPIFELLQLYNVVSKTAVFRNYTILDEDNLTLAYLMD